MFRIPIAGQYAERPGDIPASGWFAIILRVLREFSRHDMTVRAGAISFFGLFAIFPAVGACVAFYGLFANPETIVENMQPLSGFVPVDIVATLLSQMKDVAAGSFSTLVFAGVFSLVVSIWSAQQGVSALMIALNTAYLETMPHEPWVHTLKSLLTAIGVIIGLIIAGILVIGFPLMTYGVSGQRWLALLVRIAGMLLGGLILLLGLTALYRWVPDRHPPRRRWVGTGAALVVGFWTVGSVVLSIVLAFSHSYSVMYGSMGAVVALLTLTYATVVSVLLGAELNAQMEYHTIYDTTIGAPQPMGQRGAYVADHVAGNGDELLGQDQHRAHQLRQHD